MAFRFMKPKTRIVPIKKSEEDQEVLDKLQEYLDSALEEPVRFLVRFWKDQAAVLTYKELRKIAVSEEFPEEIMKDWRQDYSRLLRDKMTPVWEEAVKAGIQSNPVLQGMRFDTRELVGDWITEHTAEMVTRVTDDQVKAIRYIVGESVTYKMGADETARYIRPIVGLTEQQTAANIEYYNNIKAQMVADHPRMKPGSIEQKARDAAAKYASKQHRTRADTIARTEIITAYHEGNDRGVRECISDGRLPKMKKVWSTSLDAKVCSACQALEGVELDMDKEFSAKSGRKTVTTSIPPLHPRCACAVKYVESSEKDGIIKPDRVVLDNIENGTVKLEVNGQKQSRHIKDSTGYLEGRSYLKGNLETAKELVDKLHGTGQPIVDSKGNWTKKERVENSEIIGTVVNPLTGEESETRKAIIHYSKTGTHIIPSRED